ncbi:hypothetical protein MK079_02035 [Candidatus Gracilibacteria bacterium]|nr:hypothetical protein [Candidatus Gracilibacteria bacterium]
MKQPLFLQNIQEIIDTYRSAGFFQDEKKFTPSNILREVFDGYTDELYGSYEILAHDEENIVEIGYKKAAIETGDGYYKNILEQLAKISGGTLSPENIEESPNWDEVYNVNIGTKIKLSFYIAGKQYFVYFTPGLRWTDQDRWEYLLDILQKDGYLKGLYAKYMDEFFLLFFIHHEDQAKKIINFEQEKFKDEYTNTQKFQIHSELSQKDKEELLSPQAPYYPIEKETGGGYKIKHDFGQIIILILTLIFAAIGFFGGIMYVVEEYFGEYCDGNILQVPYEGEGEICLLCLEDETQEQCDEKLEQIINILNNK